MPKAAPTPVTKPTVAIVGGGLAGLSAAFDLHNNGYAVTVFEAADRWGGKVHSSPVGDRMVDCGADSFLARVDDGYNLVCELGLDEFLTSPGAPVPAYLHRDGKLHELPQGTFMGVPTDLDLFSQCSLISPEGVARAAQDLTLPATPLDGDISVGAYCRARLGDEVTDRLIDPLIGGINASAIDKLSLKSGSPQLAAAAASGPSLIEGLRAMRERIGATLGSKSAAPVFYGLTGGVATIIDALADHLAAADLKLNHPITSFDELATFDHVVIATPAPPASRILATASPQAANTLAEVEYSSVAQVTVEMAKDAIDPVLDASGVLFPRVDGMVLTACTWFSTKWAHYDRPETALLRMTSGRFGDTRALELDDDALTAKLLDEMSAVFDISAQPIATRVHRWENALPQYTPGHADRVNAIKEAVSQDLPNVQLAGAIYGGIGIPACIASGRNAAKAVMS